MNNKGFTLIEILIALAVFAILAAITSSAMYYAFNTRARVTAQADRLATLQLTLTMITRDTAQVVNRPVRGSGMEIFPAFVGEPDNLEFTRAGIANPFSAEKRSNLKRVALLCRDNQLIRRSWHTLDAVNRNDYEDKILLSDLVICKFAYLNKRLQILPVWSEGGFLPDEESESLPKAVQLTLSLKDWGEASLLFLIPRALYAESKQGLPS
ncbi:MAG: GspJ family T2SS minor pseudopilin variant LspJ [Legionella sp.]|nr:GspJ family T2SS minor pseudopilin variant LspJ [Legionella sp.]